MSTEHYPDKEPVLLHSSGRPYTILLVEDDLDDTEFIREAILQIVPAAVVVSFVSAVQLLNYLKEYDGRDPITLFVLDYNLPITNGLELLKTLHEDAAYRSVPKVIYSNSDRLKDKENCLAAGAVAYIKKSNSFEKIRTDAIQMLSICYPDN